MLAINGQDEAQTNSKILQNSLKSRDIDAFDILQNVIFELSNSFGVIFTNFDFNLTRKKMNHED